MSKTTIKHNITVIRGSIYRSTIAVLLLILSLPVYLRGPVEVEAAFVLNVEHQVASIQVLHYKEEVLLCKNTLLSAHCHRQVGHKDCVRE